MAKPIISKENEGSPPAGYPCDRCSVAVQVERLDAEIASLPADGTEA